MIFMIFFEALTKIEDPRQFEKVKYPINEAVGMILITSLGNANEWTEIELFCNLHKELIGKYFKLLKKHMVK